MNVFGTILHILGLIISGAVALFYFGMVLVAAMGFATADVDRSLVTGRLLGTLLIALIFTWIFMRILRGLRAK